MKNHYKNLRVNDAFRFLPDGAIYIRCRGGYRPSCGGELVRFNYPDCPVYFYKSDDAEVSHGMA